MTPDSSSPVTRRGALQGALAAGALASLPSVALSRPGGGGERPRRILFLVSDGMSQSVPYLAEALSQQVRGRGTRWVELLHDREASIGQMETDSLDSMVTDSAAASSAWGCGRRIHNGAINELPDGTVLPPVGAWLKERGGRLGLVTTATVTHATPAGFAAHVPRRSMEAEIAVQYLDSVDLALGGGLRFFDKEGRGDGRDLLADFAAAGYEVSLDRDGLVKNSAPRRLGLFSGSHVPYTLDQMQDKDLQRTVPTLAEMTANALEWSLLSDAPTLIQIEGARVDHAAHANDIAGVLWDQIAYDDALGVALDFAAGHPGTLVVTTSDHGNANPGLNGVGPSYTKSSEAFSRIAAARTTCQTWLAGLGAAEELKPGAVRESVEESFGVAIDAEEAAAVIASVRREPVVEWNHQHRNTLGLLGQILGNHNGVGWCGTTHTHDPTLVTAVGPGAERFGGFLRNYEVRGIFEDLLEG